MVTEAIKISKGIAASGECVTLKLGALEITVMTHGETFIQQSGRADTLSVPIDEYSQFVSLLMEAKSEFAKLANSPGDQ